MVFISLNIIMIKWVDTLGNKIEQLIHRHSSNAHNSMVNKMSKVHNAYECNTLQQVSF